MFALKHVHCAVMNTSGGWRREMQKSMKEILDTLHIRGFVRHWSTGLSVRRLTPNETEISPKQ